MSVLLSLVPWWARIVAVGAVLAASAAFGAVKMHQHDQKAYDALQKRFDDFQDQVRVNGLAAKAAAKAKEEEDLKRKKDADEENAHALATLAGTIARLRNAHPAGSGVPTAPTTSSRPDLACFDRTELERAFRQYRTDVRGLVDEGSAATLNLDTAKRWAQH